MRKTLTLAALTTSLFVAAQSYYYIYDQGITSDYNPFGSQGTAILTHPFDDGFSPIQTLPFAWAFYGSTVTQYKVSDNGYLTFDLGAVSSIGTNTTIPTIAEPNHAIYALWDQLELSNNPSFVTNSVRTYMKGSAPNRVHVIQWHVTPKGQLGNSAYLYFAVRIYEQGDFDVMFQQRGPGATVSATVGCEDATGTDATMLAGSPNFTYTGGQYIEENIPVYRFYFGTQPDHDVVLQQLYLQDIAHTNASYDIKGRITNQGVQTVTSLTVEYQVAGGPIQAGVINGLNVAPNQSSDFTHPIPWTPTNPNSFQDVVVRVVEVNGSPDAHPQNNELMKSVWVNLGVSGTKNVLIEEFSTAPCGWCPDGNWMLEQILDAHPEIIAFTHHSAYQSDDMTIPISVAMASAFAPGAPMACIDRIHYADQIYVAINRSDWESRALESLAEATPVDIGIVPSWNASTREISIGVTLDFVDYVLPGDLRLNVFIIEDSVTGEGAGYDQVNYLNNSVGHYYYNKGDPIIGFVHRRVIRATLTGDWGDATGIPQTAGPDDELQKPSLTYILPEEYNQHHVSIIAFVAYKETDKWQVLNAKEMSLVAPVGMKEVLAPDMFVFPNPMTDHTTVILPHGMEQTRVRLFDMSGRLVREVLSSDNTVKLRREGLGSGVYLLEAESGKRVLRFRLAAI